MKTKTNRLRILFFVVLSCMAVQTASAAKLSEPRHKLITFALQLQGTPYVFGGQSPEQGFDCSGYIRYVASNVAGMQLPRTANEIYNSKRVKKIPREEREPGDLMFFKSDMDSDRITHIGIYCGVYRGQEKAFYGKRVFISAVSDGPRTGIQLTLISERYWKKHFFAYGRILPPSIKK
ncbi:MAG: C40 family peptidase [Treponemataceae bacterium]|nr:C40 family peptidase [Treponemataceae bacterium]